MKNKSYQNFNFTQIINLVKVTSGEDMYTNERQFFL